MDNLNNVRFEVYRHFRNKKERNLKAKIDEHETNSKMNKTSEICIEVSMTLRRVTSLEVI